MVIRAGEIPRLMTLQQKTLTNVGGESRVAWSDEQEFWGSVKVKRGGENVTNEQTQAFNILEIRTRFLIGVDFTPNKRIELSWRGQTRYFNIQSVDDVDSRGFELELKVIEDTDG